MNHAAVSWIAPLQRWLISMAAPRTSATGTPTRPSQPVPRAMHARLARDPWGPGAIPSRSSPRRRSRRTSSARQSFPGCLASPTSRRSVPAAWRASPTAAAISTAPTSSTRTRASGDRGRCVLERLDLAPVQRRAGEDARHAAVAARPTRGHGGLADAPDAARSHADRRPPRRGRRGDGHLRRARGRSLRRSLRRAGRLNANAVGWSRQPVVRADLHGHWPRKKRWNFWNWISPRFVFSVTLADIDYAAFSRSLIDFESSRTARLQWRWRGRIAGAARTRSSARPALTAAA